MPVKSTSLSCGLLLLSCLGRTAEITPSLALNHANAQITVLDEIFVIGEPAGPPLWKVKSESHVVWILAVPRLTPAKLKWRPEQVDRVVRGASEVIVASNETPRTAEERAIESAAQEAWRQGRELPDGQTLRSLLSADQFARFEDAARSFAHNQKRMERLAPGHAANRLLVSATRKLGMAAPSTDPVKTKVLSIAKRHHVPVRRISLVQPGKDFAADLSASLMDACGLETLVAELDDGGAGWKAIASAWSAGNVGRLRALAPHGRVVTTPSPSCRSGAQINAQQRRAGAEMADRNQAWLGAVEHALVANTSTLAVVDLSHLLEPDGLLDTLRSAGHEVVEPR